MFRDKQKLTKTSHVLLYLLAAKGIVGRLLMCGQLRHALYPEYASHIADRKMNAMLYKLYQQGWIKCQYVEATKIIRLTRRGELEALFQKAKRDTSSDSWDQKWRMVVFDIPEDARHIRDQLRNLLKNFGFRALQASVYVYPFSLSSGAIEYLKKSGLMRYIRIAKVEMFDDDTDLRKQFRKLLAKTHGREKKEAAR